eukprot:m.473003 g.473003  ORF g.473003 m.473003 type:complete len:74 (-) comp33616_c0_seq1:49-270(-)
MLWCLREIAKREMRFGMIFEVHVVIKLWCTAFPPKAAELSISLKLRTTQCTLSVFIEGGLQDFTRYVHATIEN